MQKCIFYFILLFIYIFDLYKDKSKLYVFFVRVYGDYLIYMFIFILRFGKCNMVFWTIMLLIHLVWI